MLLEEVVEYVQVFINEIEAELLFEEGFYDATARRCYAVNFRDDCEKLH